MAIKVDKVVYICVFFWSLLSILTTTFGVKTDIACLKSIKASLEDPYGYLSSSWDFNNNTEGFICRFAGVDCWHSDENRVLNLRLNDMGLKGQFPSGIKNCTSLTGLDLSNNQLQGPIPFEIHKILPYVTSLDLSSNNFSGEIPLTIANCSYLSVLQLDHNRLTGQIPQQISSLGRLKTFSVANNLLSGPVPKFENPTFTAVSFANNSGLCGATLETCEENEENFSYSFKTGFGIGYVVSVIVYASYFVPWISMGNSNKNKKITIAAMVMLMMRKKKDKKPETDQLGSLSTMDFVPVQEEILRLEKMVTRLPYADLINATDNFSEMNIIGSGNGKMGIMFKATLSTGHFLAVKKLNYSQFLDEPFITEMKILGVLRHINLLPLVGFCIKSKEWFLVYKYMPNGRLYDWLHSMGKDQAKRVMEWPLRVKIAIGLARGLAWLHQGCDTRVFHLNISSKSILLDQHFEPKLTNFEEAMLMIPTNSTCTEFWEMAFVKEDVYSFGIVLLELITREDSRKINASSPNEWVSNILNSNSSTFHDLIDKSLIGQGFDDEICQFLQIAFNCVQSIPEQRSTMFQVYEQIKAIREREGPIDDDSKLLTKPETSTASYKGKSLDEIEIVEIY